MKRVPSAFAAALAALTLAGCASDTTNYPSLARRPVERAATLAAPPPAPSLTAAPEDPALTVRLTALVEQARKAHQRFADERQSAERTVTAGSGASPGSEGWAVASVALASLESARSDAMIALADLDQLYAAARIAGSASDGIASARDEVSGWIGAEDAVLAALRGRLGG